MWTTRSKPFGPHWFWDQRSKPFALRIAIGSQAWQLCYKAGSLHNILHTYISKHFDKVWHEGLFCTQAYERRCFRSTLAPRDRLFEGRKQIVVLNGLQCTCLPFMQVRWKDQTWVPYFFLFIWEKQLALSRGTCFNQLCHRQQIISSPFTIQILRCQRTNWTIGKPCNKRLKGEERAQGTFITLT